MLRQLRLTEGCYVQGKAIDLVELVMLGNDLIVQLGSSSLRFIHESFQLPKGERKRFAFFGEVKGHLVRKISHLPSMPSPREGN